LAACDESRWDGRGQLIKPYPETRAGLEQTGLELMFPTTSPASSSASNEAVCSAVWTEVQTASPAKNFKTARRYSCLTA